MINDCTHVTDVSLIYIYYALTSPLREDVSCLVPPYGRKVNDCTHLADVSDIYILCSAGPLRGDGGRAPVPHIIVPIIRGDLPLGVVGEGRLYEMTLRP